MEVRTGDTAGGNRLRPIGLKLSAFFRAAECASSPWRGVQRRWIVANTWVRLRHQRHENARRRDRREGAYETGWAPILLSVEALRAIPATWQQALAMVRRGGVVNFFSGLPRNTVEIDPAAIHYSEIKLISPFHHTPRFFREALEAIRRGDISARDFVTEEIRLADLRRPLRA